MYNIDDCVLIRKTQVFPENGIIETPVHGMAYEFGASSILGDAIFDKIRETYKTIADITREGKKYDVYYETYRSTVHFTINGVVANSMYGQFNYPYAIIEPLKYHIEEDSLTALRVEDTYFSDDIHLSDEAIILIPEEEKEKLAEKYDLTDLNIHTFTGNIEDAIKDELQKANYDYFEVSDHGYREGWNSGTKAEAMYDYIEDYAKKHKISRAKHTNSEKNNEDKEIREEEAEKIDLLHLQYILDSGLVSEETIDKINSLFQDRRYYKNEFKELMSDVVEQVGLDNIEQLTKEFNQKMIREREIRKLANSTSKETQQTKEINHNKRLD